MIKLNLVSRKREKHKKILFAASECAPFIKVGGLADVIGSLPKALKKIGIDVTVVIPYYSSLSIDKRDVKFLQKIEIRFNNQTEEVALWESSLPDSDVPLILISSEEHFSGEPYSEESRFLFFSQAVTEIVHLMNFSIVHCHDWHTGIIPYLLNKEAQTIFTIHNIAHQGIFNQETVNSLLGTAFSNKVNLMRIGIENADIVNTVSPCYAKEILTPEFGFGLEDSLTKRKRSLFGIINGIDGEEFDPERDPSLVQNFSLSTIDERSKNKEFIQREYFKKVSSYTPLIGMVTRIADQKGFNLVEEALPSLMEKDLQFFILGTGTEKYEKILQDWSKRMPEKIYVEIGFSDPLARRIYAASDLFLMPSHFEPCGLGQMIAMRYGSIPIVRSVGGLKDTVIHHKDGFVFRDGTPEALIAVIEDALDNSSIWEELQRNGMKKDFSWNNSARKYLKLYGRVGL